MCRFFNVWVFVCIVFLCVAVFMYGFVSIWVSNMWLSVCTGFVLSGCVYEWICVYLSYLMSLPNP